MKDPSYAMQGAVHTALTASTAVQAVLGNPPRVYDKVPAAEQLSYPYARIGDDQVVGDSNACGDGWEVYVTIHIFSNHAQTPRPQVKQVSNAIGLALGDFSALIAPAGFEVVEVSLEQSRTFFDDKDGLTCHGVMTFRYLVNDAA